MDGWVYRQTGGCVDSQAASWTQGRVGEHVDSRWWGEGCGEPPCADPEAARSAEGLWANPGRQSPCPPHTWPQLPCSPSGPCPVAHSDRSPSSWPLILRRWSFSGPFRLPAEPGSAAVRCRKPELQTPCSSFPWGGGPAHCPFPGPVASRRDRHPRALDGGLCEPAPRLSPSSQGPPPMHTAPHAVPVGPAPLVLGAGPSAHELVRDEAACQALPRGSGPHLAQAACSPHGA